MLLNFYILEITDCPRNLPADLVFHLNFLEEEVVNATAFHLVEFLTNFLHVGPQDTKLAFYLYVNDEINVTDNFAGLYNSKFVGSVRKKVNIS